MKTDKKSFIFKFFPIFSFQMRKITKTRKTNVYKTKRKNRAYARQSPILIDCLAKNMYALVFE